jgi:hypothetical protein
MVKVQDYGDVLSGLQQLAPGAHIAGGAVRDTVLGVKPRDIDVFLPDECKEEAATMLRSKFKYVRVGEWRSYDTGFSDPAITHVAKFENADQAIPICLIGLKGPAAQSIESNISRFDFGICMAAWAGNGLITNGRFDTDRENKTFTLCRADNREQLAYSLSRYEKLRASRFKDWQIAIPERFGDLLREHQTRQHWYLEDDQGSGQFGFARTGERVWRPKER